MKKKQKILVAMSGGVDSSVTAALLVREGYAVTGAYMKQWRDTRDVTGVCHWKQDRRDAMRVAAHLNIPLMTLDFEKEYKEWVMSYMFTEYEKGRTPNPDVLCNKYIKFDAWLNKVREMGFDKMATGHYARITSAQKHFSTRALQHKSTKALQHKSTKAQKHFSTSAQYELCMAKDIDKDQTYFLHQLSEEQLAYTMFPLGEYTKQEVRAMARKFDLPTAEREESMGICFVGEIPIKEFLQQKIQKTPGHIVTEDGDVVGEHEGLAFYTIGQRHIGLQTSDNRQQTDHQKPQYVLEKRFNTNELVVGQEESELLYKKEIIIGDMHWISGSSFAKATEGIPDYSTATPGRHEKRNGQDVIFPLKCMVRLRHRQPLQNATFEEDDKIIFEEPQRAVTPGQFAVIYKDGVCLGGGVIG